MRHSIVFRSGVLASILAVSLLIVGCSARPLPIPSPEPSAPSEQPTVRPVVGQSSLPLDCADLLAPADFSDLVPAVATVVDESHIEQTLEAVRAKQAGELGCAWGDSGWGGTGWSNAVSLRVFSSSDASIDSAYNLYTTLEPIEADVPTSLATDCDGADTYVTCIAVQLRDGYRIELRVTGALGMAVRSRTLELLERVGVAIDRADPARLVAPAGGAGDSAILCEDSGILAIVETRGGVGAPVVTADATASATMTCRWDAFDTISQTPAPIEVAVLPGAAWAVPFLRDGVGRYPLWYSPAADGDWLVGSGDWLAAFRAYGDDLVQITAPSAPTDPEAWEQLLADTW